MSTGTLTQNKMTVVEGWVGGKHRHSAPQKGDLRQDALEVLCMAVSVNSTAVLIKYVHTAHTAFTFKTEHTALTYSTYSTYDTVSSLASR